MPTIPMKPAMTSENELSIESHYIEANTGPSKDSQSISINLQVMDTSPMNAAVDHREYKFAASPAVKLEIYRLPGLV